MPVPTAFSDQLAQVQPPNYAPLRPNEAEGRVRLAYFTKTFASEASGFYMGLCRIPRGARLLRGCLYMSASTGSATIAIGLCGKDDSGFIAPGVADGPALCLAAQTMSTTEVPFLVTQALYQGYVTVKELYLTLTTGGAAMASQTLRGYLLYVVD